MLPSYFKIAKEASLYGDHPQHKIGAAIFIKGKPFAVGFNSKRTHPMMAKYHKKKTIHAELAVIIKVRNKNLLRGATIIVYRESKKGIPAMARPCIVCQQILRQFGIKHAIYTTNGGGYAEETFP